MVQASPAFDMFPAREMWDDTPYQPGRLGCTVGRNAVKAALAILIVMIFLEGPARAQSGTEPMVTIPVHPDVTTTLHLPDEVVRVRFTVQIAGLIGAVTGGDMVFIRPRPDIPIGEEVTVAIWTATARVRLRLRVVENARDALLEVAVVVPDAEPVAGEPARDISQAAPAEPAASTPIHVPRLVPPAAPEPAAPTAAMTVEPRGLAATEAEREPAKASAARFELSVHVDGTLTGTTVLTVRGFQAVEARQSHQAFGGRITVAPPDTWWAVETRFAGEWPAAPSVHDRPDSNGSPESREVLAVSGPRLRVDAGWKARFGAPWSATAYVGPGIQMHHRDVEKRLDGGAESRSDMPLGGVLALGLGLEYRTGALLLGVELHLRQTVPAEYRSMSVLLSVGTFLNQGNEP